MSHDVVQDDTLLHDASFMEALQDILDDPIKALKVKYDIMHSSLSTF